MFVLIFEYIEVGILQSLDLGRISILYSKMRHYWLRSILKEHYFPQFFPFFLNYCEANLIVHFFITPVYKVKFYSESAVVEIFFTGLALTVGAGVILGQKSWQFI